MISDKDEIDLDNIIYEFIKTINKTKSDINKEEYKITRIKTGGWNPKNS